MSPTSSPATLAAVVACCLSACSFDNGMSLPNPSASTSSSLDQRFDNSDSMPPWKVGTSNAREPAHDATWQVKADPTAPSAPNSLQLVDARGHRAQEFNLCWSPAPLIADVDVSVAVRADGGVEDQGGGPAWRVVGESDYYTARWNPLEDNFRVYSVVAGERLQLDSARVKADPSAWHVIRVRHVGDAITCWFDDEELLHTKDSKLSSPGGVGVWTKADATTRFDDLRAGPAE